MYLAELLTVKKYLRCGRGNKVKGGFMQKESQKPIKCALEIEAKTSFQRFLAFKDYGRPMKPFFIEFPNFGAWVDNLGR